MQNLASFKTFLDRYNLCLYYPDHLKERIFSFLSPNDSLAAELACTDFQSTIVESKIWEKRVVKKVLSFFIQKLKIQLHE